MSFGILGLVCMLVYASSSEVDDYDDYKSHPLRATVTLFALSMVVLFFLDLTSTDWTPGTIGAVVFTVRALNPIFYDYLSFGAISIERCVYFIVWAQACYGVWSLRKHTILKASARARKIHLVNVVCKGGAAAIIPLFMMAAEYSACIIDEAAKFEKVQSTRMNSISMTTSALGYSSGSGPLRT